ncbi:hypothetical protein LWI29_013655 [Acer saccharum]|uniref:Uncharacterized protein n=1 Tax=Acer saccharum TaxID=4024 RepID=A0AA39SQD1_ACESA|nr:hypothetical protein LWI29_013655 [Acer saccharum]
MSADRKVSILRVESGLIWFEMVYCRRCSEMEAEIAKKKSEHEALEVRFRALEVEKVGIEDELKAFKREKEEGIVDLTT